MQKVQVSCSIGPCKKKLRMINDAIAWSNQDSVQVIRSQLSASCADQPGTQGESALEYILLLEEWFNISLYQ